MPFSRSVEDHMDEILKRGPARFSGFGSLADRCDAVLRLGGPSPGADEEVERVRARGGDVYHSIAEVPDGPGAV
jgi:hypothetical protein